MTFQNTINWGLKSLDGQEIEKKNTSINALKFQDKIMELGENPKFSSLLADQNKIKTNLKQYEYAFFKQSPPLKKIAEKEIKNESNKETIKTTSTCKPNGCVNDTHILQSYELISDVSSNFSFDNSLSKNETDTSESLLNTHEFQQPINLLFQNPSHNLRPDNNLQLDNPVVKTNEIEISLPNNELTKNILQQIDTQNLSQIDIQKDDNNDLNTIFESAIPQQIHSDTPFTRESHQIDESINNRSNLNELNKTNLNDELFFEKQNTDIINKETMDIILKNVTSDRPEIQKFVINTPRPIQNISPLITPILMSNNLVNDTNFEMNPDAGHELGGLIQKPFSFVDASSQQKQWFDKNSGGNTDGDLNDSFSESKNGHASHIATNTADSLQKTQALQKLTQTIRERAEDIINSHQKDITINVKVPHPTLGNVDLDLKIKSNKLSIDLSSKNKDMQTMLNQKRDEIVGILGELVHSSEYTLEDNPVRIRHQEKEI